MVFYVQANLFNASLDGMRGLPGQCSSSMPEQGGQSGNQARQVHPHHSPLATVWLVGSDATRGLPQLSTAAQNHQASNTSLSLPKSHLRN